MRYVFLFLLASCINPDIGYKSLIEGSKTAEIVENSNAKAKSNYDVKDIKNEVYNLYKQEEYSAALEKLNEYSDQELSWELANIKAVILSIKNNEIADKYYKIALEKSHNNLSVTNNYAIYLAFKGRHDDAISLLEKLQLSEKNEQVANNLRIIKESKKGQIPID